MENNRSRYTFCELLSEYSVRIPLIQRDYVQGREYTDKKKTEKRQEFIRLLVDALKTGKSYHIDFIYGSPLKNQNSVSGKSFFIPLDGQQRLTTLFLLHWLLISKSSAYDKKELLKQIEGFSYETRLSSTAFCSKLTSNIISGLAKGNVKCTIIDQPWYSSDWDYDPTIINMLSMLEAMNTLLEDEYALSIDEMLKNALSADSSITFDLLDMKEYALTDGLYIKMNARGKELTNFEHWKALFIRFLEEFYNTKGYKAEFTDKIEHDWANLFWDYVKDNKTKYPVIDDCFMRYFHYLTNILYYSYIHKEGDKQEYIETIEQINAVYKSAECVEILFCSLDFLACVGKKDSRFFEELFRHGNESKNTDQVRLFSKGGLNLFQRCITPQENEDFDIYEQSLLYAIIRYCIKYEINTVTPELKKFVRVIRNLLLNTSQFIQAQVNILPNLRIQEYDSYNKAIETLIANSDVAEALAESISGLGGKNAAMLEREKQNSTNRNLICWLEDMPYCRGNIVAFKNILSSYCPDKIIETISVFNNATDADKVRLLIAAGYRGMGIGWCSYGYRYFFGKEGRWNVLFSRDAENIGKALQVFFDADCSIDEFRKNHIPAEHNFCYYALKYDEFVRSAGYWQDKNDHSSYYYYAVMGNLDNLDLISLKSYSKSPLLAYHTEPFASIVLWELLSNNSSIFRSNNLRNENIYAEKASLRYFKDEKAVISLKMTNKGWHITDVDSIPLDLQQKYNIDNNLLNESNDMDLVEIAVNFMSDIAPRL